MDDDEKVVEVKTVRTEAPATLGGVLLKAAGLSVCLALIIFVVKYSGGETPQQTTSPPQTSTQSVPSP